MAPRAASAVIAFASLANVVLPWIAMPALWFHWLISIGSAVATVGMAWRAMRPWSKWASEAAWLAVGVWVASAISVVHADLSVWIRIRSGGVYFAIAILAGSLYLIERLDRRGHAGAHHVA